MSGYNGQYSHTFFAQLREKFALLEADVRELQKPSGTQKANVVRRLAETVSQLQDTMTRMGAAEARLAAVEQTNANQDFTLNAHAGWIQDGWNAAAAAQSTANGAVSLANGAQATANGAVTLANNAQATANAAQTAAGAAQGTAGSAQSTANTAAYNARVLADHATALRNYMVQQGMNPPPPPIIAT